LTLQRLLKRSQFQAVLSGSTIVRTQHFALHCIALDKACDPVTNESMFKPSAVWIGAMAPKRWAKRAVTRNTIKRQVYTVGQLFESSLLQAAHVVRLRTSFDRQQFTSATSDALKFAVREELVFLFTKAASLVHSKPS
jgi:ribonuclease P protein component